MSQIEIFNKRKQKGRDLNKKEKERKMSEENSQNQHEADNIDYRAQLENDPLYREAVEHGWVSADALKVNSQEKLDEVLKMLRKKKEEMNTVSEGETSAPKQTGEEQAQEGASADKAGAEEAQEIITEGRTSIEVGGEAKPSDDVAWIEEKRKFWEKYAQEIGYQFENDPAKDTEGKNFTCRLTKDEKTGQVQYTAPDKVQISKESSLEMYQGIVKDALKNELSITFGNSLDEKQKAFLLAACLMETGKYKNGEPLRRTPNVKIDINADYIKELPEAAQAKLKEYCDSQETSQALTNRVAEKLKHKSEVSQTGAALQGEKTKTQGQTNAPVQPVQPVTQAMPTNKGNEIGG